VIIFGTFKKPEWEVRLWTTSGTVLFELRVEANCVSVRTIMAEGKCTAFIFGLPKTKSEELNVAEISLRLVDIDRIQVRFLEVS